MHLAPFPFQNTARLSPFALYVALPRADYYEDSVTIGLAPRMPSRVPSLTNVLARLRLPIHALQ
jgi:hypothetical protein